MIPLGDIDLQHEILDTVTGIVGSQRKSARVRRMYSARIDGRNTAVTVAMYLGDGAEEVQCYILFSQYGVSLISGGVAPGYCEVYVGSASTAFRGVVCTGNARPGSTHVCRPGCLHDIPTSVDI
jgi:hypothetical protein